MKESFVIELHSGHKITKEADFFEVENDVLYLCDEGHNYLAAFKNWVSCVLLSDTPSELKTNNKN